jgi:hypothetical protein
MFRRYIFTFGLGFIPILFMLASGLFWLIAVYLHWGSHILESRAFMSIATFCGSVYSFIPSLLCTCNPSDPTSIVPFWFGPLAWNQGFIIGALIDFLRHALSQHNKA